MTTSDKLRGFAEKAADLYLAEHPLPPAEGTEEIKNFFKTNISVLTVGEDNEGNNVHLGTDDFLIGEICHLSDVAMREFASLHAQQIADKMVEERIILDEEMAEPVQDALYATGRFTIDECNVLTEGILMYIKERGIINLKSREK